MTEPDLTPPSELNTSNVKLRNSDLNLATDPSEKDVVEIPLETGKQRKRSVLSLPSEGEEEEEYLFSRLKKQIKSHWTKIVENYPHNSMFFKTPRQEENEISNDQPEPLNAMKSSSSISTTNSPVISNSSLVNVERYLLSSAIKSVFLLPNFSSKRDDEGRRCVPFISSLLQVTLFVFI